MPEQQEETDDGANTAQFRAFVGQYGEPEAAPPWSMRAPRNRVMMMAAAVVGVAVVLAVIAFVVI